MSMQIFEESGVFDPSFWNLKVGDILQVIAVGGGGGGASAVRTGYNIFTFAHGGGYGGKAAKIPIQTTDGQKDYRYLYSGGGGGGYGGGGGGGGHSGNDIYPGAGGGGGYLKTATIKLTSLDPIAVTVGKGGRGGYDKDHLDGEDGEASSFGSYVVAEGGGGGKAKKTGIPSIFGTGGTNGGSVLDSANCFGGGGGGGYILGHMERGDGGQGGKDIDGIPYESSQDGSVTGGGGGGYEKILTSTINSSTTIFAQGGHTAKGGSIAGGGSGQDGGPGDGVVVVTW